MPAYFYRVNRNDPKRLGVEIDVPGGKAVATLFKLPGSVAKFESFSTPKAVRGGGGLSYALMKILLEESFDDPNIKSVKVEGVHGFLHYTLKNLKMAHGAWRQDPSYKGEKGPDNLVLEASFPKQARDYSTYDIKTTLWLAQTKIVEKGISLRPA